MIHQPQQLVGVPVDGREVELVVGFVQFAIGPPLRPNRSPNPEFQFPNMDTPLTGGVGGVHQQMVLARRQVGVGCYGAVGFCPVFLQFHQAISVTNFAGSPTRPGLIKLQGCELGNDGILVGIQNDFSHRLRGQRVSNDRVDGLVIDAYFGQFDGRVESILLYLVGVEGRDAFQAAHDDASSW